jgi:hypothetical protein
MIRFSNVSVVATCAALSLTLAATASAQAPTSPTLVNGGNLWSVTAFEDPAANHNQLATQGICFQFIGFVGTHLRYRWYSTTFPDWNGIASQEGDQVFMHGDYDKDNGHDGFQWEINTARNGAGHWFEWREDGGFGITIGFANAVFQRTGQCPLAVPGAALPNIPTQYFSDGTVVENPIGRPLDKQ